MAQREKEQVTVLCEGLWLNDTKPAEWKQDFPWKPSVSIHYKVLDEAGNPIDDLQKKYLKDLWLFQAMGGRNAVGRYFKLQAEHGEVPAKDGQPAKPYVSVMPIAEIFQDGTARFIEPPKEGKVNVPASTKPSGGPAGGGTKPAQPPPGPKPATPPKPSTNVEDPKKPRPKPSEAFMDWCFVPKTEKHWALLEGFTQDGYIISQANTLALELTTHQLGWWNQADSLNAPAPQDFLPKDDETYKAQFAKWFKFFERHISEVQWDKVKKRLCALLANCTKEEHVICVVERAWTKLPRRHYESFREKARIRLQEIKEGKLLPPDAPTSTPDLDPEDPPQGHGDAFEEPEGAALAEAAAEKPSEFKADPKIVAYTVELVSKATLPQKLWDLWNTTGEGYRQNPEIRTAFIHKAGSIFSFMEYQQDAVAFLKGIPAGLFTAQEIANMEAKASQLPDF